VHIEGDEMKSTRCILFLFLILCPALFVSAQEYNTEIQGFYQGYQDFSFETGFSPIDILETKLNGGGFEVAQNLAPWFAFWTRFSFYGSAGREGVFSARMFNNLYGLRYQTEQHGPFRVYAKAGLGYSNYSMNLQGTGFGETKFSFAYGAGAQIWLSEHFGAVLEATHSINGLPNVTDLDSREKWDSGLTLSAGLAVRF
jgi:opacity protein-like surface antigen